MRGLKLADLNLYLGEDGKSHRCRERGTSEEGVYVSFALHHLAERATVAFEEARARVATFVNAPAPESVVWTRGTTEAVNLVANAWGDRNVEPFSTGRCACISRISGWLLSSVGAGYCSGPWSR